MTNRYTPTCSGLFKWVYAFATCVCYIAAATPVRAQNVQPVPFYWEIQIDTRGFSNLVLLEILNDEGLPVCSDPDIQCFDSLPQNGPGVPTTENSFVVQNGVFNISTNTNQPNDVGEPIHLIIADPFDTATKFITLQLISNGATVATYVYSEPTRGDVSRTSFVRPAALPSGSPDTVFRVSADAGAPAGVKVESSPVGASYTYESALGNRLVYPYDRAACGSSTCPGLVAQTGLFLARVGEVPTATRRAFTFSANQDTQVLAGWNPNWDLPGLVAEFAPGRQLLVRGTLSASGTTFTASNPAQGWGGIQFTSSSLLDGVLVEHVSAGASIRYIDAEPNVRNSTIQNSAGPAVDGIYASGFQVGTIDRVTIQGLSGNGITFGSSAEQPVVRNSTIQDNAENGVFFNAYASGFMQQNSIQNNNGYGIYSYASYPYLGASGGASEGKNRFSQNNYGAVIAEAGAMVMGGSGSAYRSNSFLENGQPGTQWFDPPGDVKEGPDARVVDVGTVAYLRNGWWGRSANPDTTTCSTASCGSGYTGTLFVDPMLTTDPGGGAAGRAAPGLAAFAPVPESLGSARARLLDAVDASEAGHRAAALALLRATADGAQGAPAGAVAVSETGRLVVESRRGDRLGEDVTAPALAALAAWALPGSPYRARALATLVRVRHATGDEAGALAAAAELTAEANPAAALEGHYARFHLLLGSAGQRRAGFAGAAEALAVLERVAPGSAQARWARHALAVEGGEAGAGAVRDAATAGARAGARATAASDVPAGEASLSVWPNPAAGRSTVGLTLAEASDVSVVLYDVLGREAAVVHRGRLDVGVHRLGFDAASLPAGTYVARAQVGADTVLVRTLTVAR